MKPLFFALFGFLKPPGRGIGVLLALTLAISCQYGGPVLDDVFDGDDGNTDWEEGTDTGGDDVDAIAECEDGIAEWYDRGCFLSCHSGCGWSTQSDPTRPDAPLSIEYAQAFCQEWVLPACLAHLEMMLDCWEHNFVEEALCPAPCLLDDGMPVLEVLELCLDSGEGEW